MKDLKEYVPNAASSLRKRLSNSATTGSGKALSATTGTLFSGLDVDTLRELRETSPTSRCGALVRLLPPRSGCFVVPVLNRDFEVTGWKLHGEVKLEAVQQALDCVNVLMRPSPKAEIIQGLVKIMSLTKSRNMDEDEKVLYLGSLSEELQSWPADLVEYSLRKWVVHSIWWPTIKELIELTQGQLLERLMLWKLLSQTLSHDSAHPLDRLC